MSGNNIIIRISELSDLQYVNIITKQIDIASQTSGVNILKRSAELITEKILKGEAVIATTTNGIWVGFSYIQQWDNGTLVSNCGLIVNKDYRQKGIASRIKQKIVQLSKHLYPGAKMFGLTSSLAVMKINTDLGFIPVTYSEITQDEKYWSACASCPNHSILLSRNRKNCLCTAMLHSS